jgi:hypothetical protein
MMRTLRLRTTVLSYAIVLRLLPTGTNSRVTCDMALHRLLERLASADNATGLPPVVRPILNHRQPR